MKPKKIYQILFPGLSYESEPLMDAIWLSLGVVGLICAAVMVWG